jgi:hypothetical protein
VDVDAEHLLRDAGDRLGGAVPGGACSLQVAADGVEDERPGAAGRVEHSLGQRGGHGVLDDGLGQPVRGVVLPERLAGVGADHRFVQHLHHVVLDCTPGEAGQPPGQRADERRSTVDLDNPVEEVLLDDAANLRGSEQLPAHQRGRA